jgi:pimeloyl-ACP methyl ester carboxylesterase
MARRKAVAEVSNQGVRIRYDVTGSGRPIVLLHGWGCDRTWGREW